MRLPLSFLLASLLVGGTLTAQTKPCFGMNDANTRATTAISLKGPNVWFTAVKWTPGSTVVAQGMSVFTGNKFGDVYQTLEVWSHDATADAPKARLTGGTMAIPKGTVHSWIGTNFDKVQVMVAKTTYWLVWGEPGWSYSPNDPLSTQKLPTRRRAGATAAWGALGSWGFKFRMFCNRQDGARAKTIGNPCASSAGLVPTNFTNADPKVGNADFRLEGTGVPSGAPALLILGARKNWVSLPLVAAGKGCWLNTDIVFVFGGRSGTGNHQATFSVGAANHVLFPFPIPNNSTLAGVFLGTQIAVLDAKSSSALPLVLTNGLQITLH
jgi:hypothetical protein